MKRILAAVLLLVCLAVAFGLDLDYENGGAEG